MRQCVNCLICSEPPSDRCDLLVLPRRTVEPQYNEVLLAAEDIVKLQVSLSQGSCVSAVQIKMRTFLGARTLQTT